jgi:hypothetical protein
MESRRGTGVAAGRRTAVVSRTTGAVCLAGVATGRVGDVAVPTPVVGVGFVRRAALSPTVIGVVGRPRERFTESIAVRFTESSVA